MRALSSKSLHPVPCAVRRVAAALLLCVSVARAYAQEPVAAGDSTVSLRTEPGTRPRSIVRSKSIEGFGPDAQLTGGVGFGFEAKLENFFLARARLGVLYAAEPWIANLGFTAEVGALAGLGWGGELELSRAGTLFGLAGVSRVDESRWLAHLGVGFTIFGLEWQHVFGGSQPHNALLLEVRVPLGLWWLHKRQEKAEAESAAASRSLATPHIIQRPTSNPTPLTAPTQTTPQFVSPNEAAGRAAAESGAPGAGGLASASGASDPDAAVRGAHGAAATASSSAGAAAAPSGSSGGTAAASGESGRAAAGSGGSDSAATPSGSPGGTAAASGAHGVATAASSAPGAGAPASKDAGGARGDSRAATDVAALEVDFAERMAEAQSARERSDHLAEAIALSRAYTLRPEPSVALQLSAAELALNRPRSALADWQRIGDPQKLSPEDRARATQLRQQITADLAQLRLTLSGGLSEQDVVWIDGIVEPTANRGYDVPLDPGDHNLQVKRAGHLRLERAFHVDPGKLLRLELELPRD